MYATDTSDVRQKHRLMPYVTEA